MMLGRALAYVHGEELDLADAYRAVADKHAEELDLAHTCRRFAEQCERRAEGLRPFVEKYGAHAGGTLSRRIRGEVLGGARRLAGKVLFRSGVSGTELLIDLRRLYGVAHGSAIDWLLLGEAGHAAHDSALRDHAGSARPEKEVQIRWIKTRLRQSAPQVLVFSAPPE